MIARPGASVRVAHPFDSDVAVRLIIWFPPASDSVVVALFAGDKARMGDVVYNSVGSRTDAAIRSYLQHTPASRQEMTAMSDSTTFVGTKAATARLSRLKARRG